MQQSCVHQCTDDFFPSSSPGWPWPVCPADAYSHPHHRLCSQPDDGLQSTLQFEPQAVSSSFASTLLAWAAGCIERD